MIRYRVVEGEGFGVVEGEEFRVVEGAGLRVVDSEGFRVVECLQRFQAGCWQSRSSAARLTAPKVDIRQLEEGRYKATWQGNSNSHGARPAH